MFALKGKRNGKKAAARPMPDRRHPFLRFLRRRWVRRSALVLGLGLAIGGPAFWFIAGPGRVTLDRQWQRMAMLAAEHLDMQVRGVTIATFDGTDPQPTIDLVGQETLWLAIDAPIGSPTFSFDAARARERVEALAWVARADVEVALWGKVRVRLEQRQPFALWQRTADDLVVIDREGVPLTDDGLSDYLHLPLVTGPGANVAAGPLLALLAEFPDIEPQIVSAQRLGERRWTLHFANGVELLLPEKEVDAAFADFVDAEREHRILDRDILAIDMRQPDRWVLRLTPRAVGQVLQKGQET